MTNEYEGMLSRLRAWYVDAAEAVRQGDRTGREILRDASCTYDANNFRPIIADIGDGIPLYGIMLPEREGKPRIQLSMDLGKMVRIAEAQMRVA